MRPPEYYIARLLNRDGRFRRNIQYLFHALTCKDLRGLDSGIYASLNCSTYKGGMTAGEIVKNVDEGNQEFQSNLSTMLSAIRGTKEYWSRQASNLTAMDEKYGSATFFITLSCAEYHWSDVDEVLRKTNADLENVEKARIGSLCAIDPVTVTSQFEQRYRAFLNNIILDKNGPLGEVEHYYCRLEWQARGAPHIHAKLWCKNAKVLGKDPDEEVLAFIQKYITCELPDEKINPELYKLV